MKRLLPVLIAIACGGPTQKQIVETPAAKGPWVHYQSPPASTSDQQRYQLNQQFREMETTQRAYREAEQGSGAGAAPKGKHVEYPPDYKPEKKGPAVEAPKPKP